MTISIGIKVKFEAISSDGGNLKLYATVDRIDDEPMKPESFVNIYKEGEETPLATFEFLELLELLEALKEVDVFEAKLAAKVGKELAEAS